MIEEKIIYRDSRGKIEEVYFGVKTVRYCITWMNGEELWTNDLPLAHQLLASKGEARQMTIFDLL